MRSRADTKGVLVTKVEPGSDAEQQGVTAGDLVLQTRTMCRALKNSGARSTGCAAKAGGSAFLRLSKIQPVAVNQFPGAKWTADRRRLASVDRPRYVAEKSGAKLWRRQASVGSRPTGPRPNRHRRCGSSVSVDRETCAAAAGGFRVRIANREVAAHQFVSVVQFRASQKVKADGVDDNARGAALDDQVVRLIFSSSSKRYWKPLHPPASTATRSAVSAACSSPRRFRQFGRRLDR